MSEGWNLMTDMLGDLLERLNEEVRLYNERIKEALELEQVDANKAKRKMLPEGCVTEEIVKDPGRWTYNLLNALQEVIVLESPQEVVRLADCAKSRGAETRNVKFLRIGAKKSLGYADGPAKGFPCAIRLLDMAHLVAHSGASRAVLLGQG